MQTTNNNNNKRLNSAALLQVPEERGLSRAGVSRRDRGLVLPAADETSTASANAGTATDQKTLSSDHSSSSQVHADVRPFHKQVRVPTPSPQAACPGLSCRVGCR